MAVRDNAEGEALGEVGDVLGGELGAEGCFGVKLAKTSLVKLGDKGETGESNGGGGEVADAEAVVEAAIGGAWRDHVVARDEVARVKRGIPEAINPGPDNPVVSEVVMGLVGLDHGKASFH